MTPKEFIQFYKQVMSQSPPIRFLFAGECQYMKEVLLRGFKRTVAGFEDFNLETFWMDDKPDIFAIINSLVTFPVMGDRRIVILRAFEPSRANEQRFISKLASMDFPKTTVLLAESKSPPDRRTKTGKNIAKLFQIFDFPMPNQREMLEWVYFFVMRNKKKITPKAANNLVEKAGVSLLDIRSEIEKLVSYVESERIDVGDVEDVVSHSRSAHIFQFSNAFIELDFRKATKLATELMSFGETYAVILSWIRRGLGDMVWAKVSPGKLGEKLGRRAFLAERLVRSARRIDIEHLFSALKVLHEADMLVKSGSADEKTAVVWALGTIEKVLSAR